MIHDFYQREVSSFPAVHLTMDTALTNERLGVKTYIAAPVGITSKAENCMFVPVPCDVKYFKAERAGRKFHGQDFLLLPFVSMGEVFLEQ